MTTRVAVPAHALNAHQRLLGYIALAMSIVGVGSALIFVRLSEVDPTATLMLRMVAASFILSAIMVPSGRVASWSDVSPRDLGLLVLSSVVSGADLLANQWSVHFTSIANTALLINLSPIFVLLLSWLVLRRGRSIPHLAAVMLACIGGAIVLISGGKLPSLPPNHIFGDALALLSAFLYAVYLLMTKDLRQRVPTFVVMLTNSVVIAAVLLPVVLTTSSPTLPRGFGGYAIIVAYAIVSQLLGHGLMAYALRTIDAGLASVSALLRPVVAVVLGWLILGEGVNFLQIVGGAGILTGLLWYQYLSWKPSKSAPTGQWPASADGSSAAVFSSPQSRRPVRDPSRGVKHMHSNKEGRPMTTSKAQGRQVPRSQDRILLLLCPAPDTVTWCEIANDFTKPLFAEVKSIFWGHGDPYPTEIDSWEGEWIISFRGDLIVPEHVYSKAKKGAINFHPSPPHFRGLGGHYYAIYEDHATFGTTCHHMAKSVDTGEIIDVKYFTIAPGETATSLRHHVGAYSLAQYFEIVSNYIAKAVPLPISEEEWGDKLYTSKELARWIEEKKAIDPDQNCFK